MKWNTNLLILKIYTYLCIQYTRYNTREKLIWKTGIFSRVPRLTEFPYISLLVSVSFKEVIALFCIFLIINEDIHL